MRLDFFFSPQCSQPFDSLLHYRFPEEKHAGCEKWLGLSARGVLTDR